LSFKAPRISGLPDGLFSNQKYQFWENFQGFEKVDILWPFGMFYEYMHGIFYDHLVHFVLIWYIFPVLVSCTKKNLATLPPRIPNEEVGHFKVSDNFPRGKKLDTPPH
jgi:hypothetical protein